MTSFGGGARKQLNCADNGGGQGWGGGGLHYKNDKGACSSLEGLKNRMLSIKRFTAEAFELLFRVLN